MSASNALMSVIARVQEVADEIDHEYGRLDILINNAAGQFDFAVTALSADLLFGAWHMAQALAPLLKKASIPGWSMSAAAQAPLARRAAGSRPVSPAHRRTAQRLPARRSPRRHSSELATLCAASYGLVQVLHTRQLINGFLAGLALGAG